jgi:hypothetical protein
LKNVLILLKQRIFKKDYYICVLKKPSRIFQIIKKTSYMKKVFVLMLGFVLTISVMAQKVSGDYKIDRNSKQSSVIKVTLPADSKQSALLTPGEIHKEWINFGKELCQVTAGDTGTYYKVGYDVLFPDTFINIRDWSFHTGKFVWRDVNWCSVGSVFEPTSNILRQTMGTDKVVKPYAAYAVDSIEIPYFYDRFTDPAVVDTLVIQMYKDSKLNHYTYLPTSPNPNKPAFAVPSYSRSKKEGAMADWTLRIPLKSTDTVTSRIGFIRQAIPGFSFSKGGAVGITWTFKSGSSYGYLDTIPLTKWDSLPNIQNPLNAFYWFYFVDVSQEELLEFNNGVNVNSQQRYSDLIWPKQTESNYPGTYLSFSEWTNPMYPWVSFKIRWTESVSINDQTKDVKVQLYPIPASQNENANLDMNLTAKKNVSIDVYDLLGHKVSSVANGNFNAGKYTFSINTSTFNAGMYICNIVADGAVKTIKFEVR